MKGDQTTLDLFKNQEVESYETLTLNTENLINEFDEEFLNSTDGIKLSDKLDDASDKKDNNEEKKANVNLNDNRKSSVENKKTDLIIDKDDEDIELKKISNDRPPDDEEIRLIKESLKSKKEGKNQVEDTSAETDSIMDTIELKDKIKQEINAKKFAEDVIQNPDNYGKVNIMAIGIGGCGCNAIDRMQKEHFENIRLIAIDTSRQSLDNINADTKLLIGNDILNGHGSGNDIEKATEAFLDAREDIENIFTGVDMVFLAGGIGRGTGSAGLVEVGKIARELGILTIGFATLPRAIEANMQVVEQYYQLFMDAVDSNIIIENEKVNKVAADLPIGQAMKIADQMLIDGIRGISDLITNPGKINLDYADIKTAFSNQGSCVMGIGYGTGENAVVQGIESSINSEIINYESIENAQTIIFNITCAKNTVTIQEASDGTDLIYSRNSSHNIQHMLFGYSYDETLGDKVKVTFIATGTGAKNFDSYKKDLNKSASLFGSGQGRNITVDIFSNSNKNDKPDFFR